MRVVAVSVEKKDGLVSAILVGGKRYSFDYKDGIIEKISSQQRPQSQWRGDKEFGNENI